MLLGTLDRPLKPTQTCEPQDISEDDQQVVACLCETDYCNSYRSKVGLSVLSWKVEPKHTWTGEHRWIFCQKIEFFPSQRKNCEKLSPYFSLSEVENFSKLHFFGKKLSRLAFFGEKLQKFANLGVKIEKYRVKVSIFALFGVKISPHSYFPPPY